jgi:hypothetical protein
MRDDVHITIPAAALRAMTPEQLEALQTHVVGEGRWENVEEPVFVSGTDYLGVHLPGIFLGIERDGYCHS